MRGGDGGTTGGILSRIVERGLYVFADSVPSWREAVRLGTEPLAANGYCSPDYWRQIADCIQRYGPYMVYAPGIAMPHAQVNAPGAWKTAVSFLRVREPVDFGVDGADLNGNSADFGGNFQGDGAGFGGDGVRKTAKLFFTLVSADSAAHLDNIRSLMDVFTNVPLLDALQKAETPEDILRAEASYFASA